MALHFLGMLRSAAGGNHWPGEMGGEQVTVPRLTQALLSPREQALEQEREQQLQQEHPKLGSSECVECVEEDREAVLTPEHR